MSSKSSFTLNDKDVIRVSSFMANANEVFRTSPFIKNFDYLDLFFYIYRNDTLLKKAVRFKDLSIYSSKSDVYLTKFLKRGLESGYLSCIKSTKDKRIKTYHVTKNALPFLKRIYNFEKLD